MKHWTEIDFQNWLYGLREEDRHFEECAECSAEKDRLAVQRRRILADRLPQYIYRITDKTRYFPVRRQNGLR